MSSNAAPAAVGDIIAGRYRLDAWLGQGNMAVVFRATHLGTSQECALKLILPHIVERPDVRELFLKEARVGARIGRNPHIVDVIDAGFDETRKVPFMAMELLEGETLERYVKDHGAASPALVRMIFLQIADALEQAHAKGVVHRDLKPGNLFLTFDRKKQAHIKLVDFGIAKVTELEVQRTATQVGTPAYAAPEQLGAHLRSLAATQGVIISSSIGPTTDVWPLGLIAYELLIGASPGHLWNTESRSALIDLLMGIVLEPTPKASQRAGNKTHALPKGFDEWLERCLRKNAVVRWPSVKEAVAELVSLLDEGYEDEATRQIDAVRANAVGLGLRVSRPSVPPEDMPAKNLATLPLVPIPEKPSAAGGKAPSLEWADTLLGSVPEKPSAAGPRGTAVMDVKRDATGRPISLSHPDALDERDENEREVRAVPVFQKVSSVPAPRPWSPAGAAKLRTTLPLAEPTSAPLPAVHFPAAQGQNRSFFDSFPIRKLFLFGVPAGVLLGIVITLLMPQKGQLKIEVKVNGGTASTPIEIFVDGKKFCDVSPCIAKELSPGKHHVGLSVNGKVVDQTESIVEAGKEVTVPFNVVSMR